jgi:catechol 2,3-dioxygenase
MSGDLGHGRAYRFLTPSGHVAEVFWDVERYAAPPAKRSRFPNRVQTRRATGADVRFLHHANLASGDVARDRVFFEDVLGFTSHEIVVVPGAEMEIVAFLACTNLDHDLGLTLDAVDGPGRLNHLAYALESREAVLLAADTAVEAGLSIELGPTKHGVGESFFCYVHEPSGQRIEIYSGGYLNFEPDRPVVRWDVTASPQPMLAWGGVLPESVVGKNVAERIASLRTAHRESY